MDNNVVDMTRKIGNRMLITHDDPDGVGCAVIYTKCFPKATVLMAKNDEVDRLIQELITTDEFPIDCHLMVSDLSITDETIDLITNYPKVNEIELIDHHWSAVERMKKYPWALVDAKFCATRHMYNLFKDKFNIADYEPFVMLIDNYDRWGEGKGPSEDARNLANIFYFIGKETFYNRYVQISNVKLTSIELALLDIYNRQKAEYIEESIKGITFMKDAEGNKFGVVFGDNYMTELGHHLLEAYPDVEYVCILNHRAAKISLRSRGKVNVGKIALECGGGGHARAAGFPMTENPAQAYFTRFGATTEQEMQYMEQLGRVTRSMADLIEKEDFIDRLPEDIQEFVKENIYGYESEDRPIIN